MKQARISGCTIKYYGAGSPTKLKRDRWPVKIGERECRWRWVARLLKFIYERI